MEAGTKTSVHSGLAGEARKRLSLIGASDRVKAGSARVKAR